MIQKIKDNKGIIIFYLELILITLLVINKLG